MPGRWRATAAATFGQAVLRAKGFATPPVFAEAQCGGRMDFGDVAFPERTVFDGARLQFGNPTSFAGADLEHVTFRGVRLQHCRFGNSQNLQNTEFDRVTWGEWQPRIWSLGLPGHHRLAVADEHLARGPADQLPDPVPALQVPAKPSGNSRINPLAWAKWMFSVSAEWLARKERLRQERKPLLEAAERVYRAIRIGYESRKDYARASDFYFGEMEMRRLAIQAGSWHRGVLSPTTWYGLLSGYGERWAHALGWFAAVVLVSAALYASAGLWIKSIDLRSPSPGSTPTAIPGPTALAAPEPSIGVPQQALPPAQPGDGRPPGGPPTPIAGESQARVRYLRLEPAPLSEESLAAFRNGFGEALLHSFLVATLVGRDAHAQPLNAAGQVVQAVEIVSGPVLVALMLLGIRRRFQR
jgi:hypothetical protein